ncbi:MAG: DHH family phosphoesterase, partial [Clostridiales bacterium]
MAKWMLKQAPIKSSELAQALSIEPIIARILAVRGYHDPESARQFLHAGEQELASVWLFADMEKAVKIAATAINEHMRVAVFGDYDVDGVMSTVILTKTFTSLSGDVVFYIPERESEGYGLNNEAILKLKNRGVDCIFACDNGVTAMEQVEYANSLGMKIVILDHHALLLEEDEQGKTHQLFPAAAAIVDAKRDDCSYPFENYCAAGICYRFSQAIYEYLGKNWQSLSRELLPLAAIATVCDIVELVGENRFLVQRGLPQIPQSSNLGIQALLRATGISDKVIGTYQIGFILGPCINASGRLEMAEKAVELFLADNPEVAAQQATYLAELNTCRRTLTEQGTAIALAIIEKLQLTTDKVIVIYSPEIAESVAGIIAGRIKEKFCRP